jgi:hypothetical protein
MLIGRISLLVASAAFIAVGTQLATATGMSDGITTFGRATSDHLDVGFKRIYDGQLIGVGEDSISFLGQDGATRGFSVDAHVMITRDGTKARLADLQYGDRVKVTTETRLQFKEVATIIEANSRSLSFADRFHRVHDSD